MNDEDEILEELPIFLSKNLSQSMYAFQMPNLQHDYDFANMPVSSCLMKPLNNEVKLDLTLDTESSHFDRFKGEQFAAAADGKNRQKGERPKFEDGIMNRQSYISSIGLEESKRYVIGVLQDKELHITPLKAILQFRPNFSYFDKLDKRNKAEEKAEKDADDEEKDQLKAVKVSFSRNENEKIKKARERTFAYIQQKSAEEPWCETMWHNKDSEETKSQVQKLFAHQTQPIGDLGLPKEQYIELLTSREKTKSIDTVLPSKVISKLKLKTLPLLEQLQTLLRDAKVLSFTDIMHMLESSTVTTEKVLRTLPQAGHAVRGNWVAQSEIIYPPGTFSGTNGVPAELMCRARDYIVYKLSKTECLNRNQVALATQIPPEEVKEVLETVAVLRPNRTWELMLPPDTGFESKYSDIIFRQEIHWKAYEEKFQEMETDRLPKRVRKRSIREVKMEPK